MTNLCALCHQHEVTAPDWHFCHDCNQKYAAAHATCLELAERIEQFILPLVTSAEGRAALIASIEFSRAMNAIEASAGQSLSQLDDIRKGLLAMTAENEEGTPHE